MVLHHMDCPYYYTPSRSSNLFGVAPGRQNMDFSMTYSLADVTREIEERNPPVFSDTSPRTSDSTS